MMWDMRAPELEGQDVAAALEQASRQALTAHLLSGGTPVDFTVRVTGERGRVSLKAETAALYVTVVDNGVGFDVASADSVRGIGHWGLLGMAERARSAAGSLPVTSAPGAVTTITLHLPLS